MIARTAFLLFVTASMLLGQTTNATLRGSITDQSGAVLPGVTITAKNQSTAVERTTLSDETGNYQLAALPVIDGVYETPNPSGTKRLLDLLGRPGGPVRPPLRTVTPGEDGHLARLLPLIEQLDPEAVRGRVGGARR